ncbi:hypothetical protein [Parapedobacter tibetensis]|uniref:hypothetical protein n=1 Tax=Parapedobacter tibetensis TaxID=2972951 RepID=UPI002152459A|nr:hypothetical protein [Parapedobacter tibetensis]
MATLEASHPKYERYWGKIDPNPCGMRTVSWPRWKQAIRSTDGIGGSRPEPTRNETGSMAMLEASRLKCARFHGHVGSKPVEV